MLYSLLMLVLLYDPLLHDGFASSAALRPGDRAYKRKSHYNNIGTNTQSKATRSAHWGPLRTLHELHGHVRDAKVGDGLPVHAACLPLRARLPVLQQHLDAPVAHEAREEPDGLRDREPLPNACGASAVGSVRCEWA